MPTTDRPEMFWGSSNCRCLLGPSGNRYRSINCDECDGQGFPFVVCPCQTIQLRRTPLICPFCRGTNRVRGNHDQLREILGIDFQTTCCDSCNGTGLVWESCDCQAVNGIIQDTEIAGKLFSSFKQKFNEFATPTNPISRLSRGLVGKVLLDSGRADFDSSKIYGGKAFPPKELVDLYCFAYMPMHFATSLVQLYLCKDLLFRKLKHSNFRVRFVDVGCGPFTSGLSLLTLLREFPDPISVDFVGIDRSTTMLAKAEDVAELVKRELNATESKITLKTCFFKTFKEFSDAEHENGELVVFNLCYLMSSIFDITPLIEQMVVTVNKNSEYGKFIFYQNPVSQDLPTSWPAMRNRLTKFRQNEDAPTKLSVRYKDRCNTWPTADGFSSTIKVDCAVLEEFPNG